VAGLKPADLKNLVKRSIVVERIGSAPLKATCQLERSRRSRSAGVIRARQSSKAKFGPPLVVAW
jgi:hypothetical protein